MRYGYGFVTDKGFIAFAHDLEEGAWKEVSIKKYNVADQVPIALLLEAPRPVVWKARATWSIDALSAAMDIASADRLAALDGDWDSAQRALHLYLSLGAENRDMAHRAACGRLRAALLVGAGTEQTGYGYDTEVDFGRKQLSMARKPPLADDAKRISAGPYLKRIEESTDALAKGLGRGPGQKRAAARSKRIREAMVGCTTAFNAIHDEVGWLIEHTPAGRHREQLEALHTPFLALLERNPPRALPTSDEEDGEGDATPAKPPA
jgi:hypothetical protein